MSSSVVGARGVVAIHVLFVIAAARRQPARHAPPA